MTNYCFIPFIQPEVHPGQCWAFRGTQGYLVIQTSTTIFPSGFTLEHIPKSLAPSGVIDSAPKDFTVLVLSIIYICLALLVLHPVQTVRITVINHWH